MQSQSAGWAGVVPWRIVLGMGIAQIRNAECVAERVPGLSTWLAAWRSKLGERSQCKQEFGQHDFVAIFVSMHASFDSIHHFFRKRHFWCPGLRLLEVDSEQRGSLQSL